MNVDKTLFGMNVIVGASGFGGLLLLKPKTIPSLSHLIFSFMILA